MKWLIRICAAVAAFLFWKADMPVWMIVCIIFLVVIIFTDYFMQAIFNKTLTEIACDKESMLDPVLHVLAMDSVPDWLTQINMLFSFASIIALIASLVVFFL